MKAFGKKRPLTHDEIRYTIVEMDILTGEVLFKDIAKDELYVSTLENLYQNTIYLQFSKTDIRSLAFAYGRSTMITLPDTMI